MRRSICVALILLLLCGCAAGSAAPELAEPVTVGSDMAVAAIGNIYDGTVMEGNILPRTEALSFASAGRVGEVCVTLGEQVEAGQTLIRLDTSALQAQRDAVADALDYARTMDGYSSREAELTRQMLALQYGADSARVRLYVNEQKEAAQQRADSLAELEQQLADAENALNVQSVLTAPCSGTVAAVNVNVGDMVWPQAEVAVVTDDSSCYLQTEFLTETTIRAATEVYATIGGLRYEIDYVPMDSGDYITKMLSGASMYSTFELAEADSGLIGQYALLYLMTAQREQVLCVPANAVLRDASGYYVYVNQDGVKERRDLEVGLTTAAQVEILSGLEEGERVYVVG